MVARLTKAALSVLQGPDLRYIVMKAGINETATEVFRRDPKEWAGLIARDKTAQQKFLALNLDAQDIVAGVHRADPDLLEASHYYLKRIQKAVLDEEDRLPTWEETIAEFSSRQPQMKEEPDMVRDARRRRRMRNNTSVNNDVNETEDGDEEATEAPAEEAAEPEPAKETVAVTTVTPPVGGPNMKELIAQVTELAGQVEKANHTLAEQSQAISDLQGMVIETMKFARFNSNVLLFGALGLEETDTLKVADNADELPGLDDVLDALNEDDEPPPPPAKTPAKTTPAKK